MTLNLISDAWIAVRRQDGTRDTIRPAQILDDLDTNPVIFPDWPRPDLNIATLEFLIGLVSIALAPKDGRDWSDNWNRPPSVADLDKAFTALAPAFNLDGDTPCFMQDFSALDEKGGSTPIEALLIDSAGTNAVKKNADVMVKRERVGCYARASAAIVLYALQQFAPSGGAGHRTSMRGGGPLTTLILPPNASNPKFDTPTLWQIIWANTLAQTGKGFKAEDISKYFPWMAQTRTSQSKPVVEIHQKDPDVHPLHCFFGMPRRIRLKIEDNIDNLPCDLTGQVDSKIVTAYVTNPWGMNYGVWEHPLSPYYQPKKDASERLPLHPHAGRFGYEQWLSVLLGYGEGDNRFRAAVIQPFLKHRNNIPVLKAGRTRILVSGWAMSNMQPLDFILSEQPFYLTETLEQQEELDGLARRMVEASSYLANTLLGAIQNGLETGGNKPDRNSALLGAAREDFFARTEFKFHTLLSDSIKNSHIGEEGWAFPYGQQWLKFLQITALKIFDEKVPLDVGRVDAANKIVTAKKKLRGVLFAKKVYDDLQIPAPDRGKRKKK